MAGADVKDAQGKMRHSPASTALQSINNSYWKANSE
jgi:hypothetical protein